jgi:hypothetical protein
MMSGNLVEYGEYLPDLPAFNNPGSTVAKNVIPAGESYEPFPTQVVYSNALNARCQGATSTKDADGNSVNFAGNTSKLYRMATGSYADVSKGGGYTTSTDNEMWYWARFNNLLLATNFADAIQKFTVNTSTNFADLAAGAPKARYITTSGSFVIVGNTFDGVDGNVPHRVRWCALGDPTDWTVSATTQADYNDLDVSKGWVKGVVGGEYVVVFQERAISRMEYIGSPVIWQFREVESGRGTMAPGSIVKVGNLIFYLGLDGFYAFDGNQSIPIGSNKVDKTLMAELDTNYFGRITATSHPDKQLIIWALPVSGNTSGRPNKLYIYNYSPAAKKRWSTVEDIDIEVLSTSISEGYTLDQLDSVSATLDGLLYSLDSRVWTGDNFILSGFNSDHKQINFTGSARDAVLETKEFQLFPGRRSEIKSLRPLVDGSGTVTMQMGTRNLPSESVSYGTSSSVTTEGNCEFRSEARFHRFRTTISGGFNSVQGVEILDAAKGGIR